MNTLNVITSTWNILQWTSPQIFWAQGVHILGINKCVQFFLQYTHEIRWLTCLFVCLFYLETFFAPPAHFRWEPRLRNQEQARPEMWWGKSQNGVAWSCYISLCFKLLKLEGFEKTFGFKLKESSPFYKAGERRHRRRERLFLSDPLTMCG